MDLGLLLAPSYRDLKYPTSRQNLVDTSGQIPKLILTLRHILIENPVLPQISCLTFESANSEENPKSLPSSKILKQRSNLSWVPRQK